MNEAANEYNDETTPNINTAKPLSNNLSIHIFRTCCPKLIGRVILAYERANMLCKEDYEKALSDFAHHTFQINPIPQDKCDKEYMTGLVFMINLLSHKLETIQNKQNNEDEEESLVRTNRFGRAWQSSSSDSSEDDR
ncbi:unnamed protein product [Caenorhabditis angaria]|uniref:Uncharacterized protein n=1 Tax=Caenorhabditis angaria TaxID=860376 RepID=A0A9P1IGH7_9PELO|nr:unnamed protein product [Caenorhabditis angaria]